MGERPVFFRAKNLSVNTWRSGPEICALICAKPLDVLFGQLAAAWPIKKSSDHASMPETWSNYPDLLLQSMDSISHGCILLLATQQSHFWKTWLIQNHEYFLNQTFDCWRMLPIFPSVLWYHHLLRGCLWKLPFFSAIWSNLYWKVWFPRIWGYMIELDLHTVFPHIVAAATILFWIHKSLKISYSFLIKFSLM